MELVQSMLVSNYAKKASQAYNQSCSSATVNYHFPSLQTVSATKSFQWGVINVSLQHHHFHARKDDISIPLFSHPSERSLNASFTRSSDAAERASFSFGRPRKTEMAPVTKSGGEKPAEQRSSHAEVKRSRPSLATACFFLKRRGSLD